MVSGHFSWDEVVTTDTGLENEIPEVLKPNAQRLADTVLEPLRVLLGPMRVDSWYRSPAVNKAVGGEETSYHRLALAADCVPAGNVFNKFKLALTLLDTLPIDQIIFEHRHSDWIHIGTAKDGATPRRQALVSEPNPITGKTDYRAYRG
jgi:hypothetical protein